MQTVVQRKPRNKSSSSSSGEDSLRDPLAGGGKKRGLGGRIKSALGIGGKKGNKEPEVSENEARLNNLWPGGSALDGAYRGLLHDIYVAELSHNEEQAAGRPLGGMAGSNKFATVPDGWQPTREAISIAKGKIDYNVTDKHWDAILARFS